MQHERIVQSSQFVFFEVECPACHLSSVQRYYGNGMQGYRCRCDVDVAYFVEFTTGAMLEVSGVMAGDTASNHVRSEVTHAPGEVKAG